MSWCSCLELARWLLLFVVFLCCIEAHAHGSFASNGCSKTPLIPPGIPRLLTIDVHDKVFGIIPRTYRLLLPENYDSAIAYKFVIDFHGFGMNANQEEDQDHIVEISGYGVILVWPNGSNDTDNGSRGWNAVGTAQTAGKYGHTCARDRLKWDIYECYDSCHQLYADCRNPNVDQCYCGSCWDDAAFVEQLMEYLSDNVCIDLSHLHATGISSGGLMTYEVAQSLSNMFASVIVVEGAPLLGFNVAPEYPISLLDFHGFSDVVVPGNVSNSYQNYTGPHGSSFSSEAFYYTPLDNITKIFNETNKCGTTDDWKHYPTVFDGIRDFYCVSPYGVCEDGIDIVRCAGDWGHTWPLWQVEPQAYPNIVYEWISQHPKKNVIWFG